MTKLTKNNQYQVVEEKAKVVIGGMYVLCTCNRCTGPVYIYIFITTINSCQYLQLRNSVWHVLAINLFLTFVI